MYRINEFRTKINEIEQKYHLQLHFWGSANLGLFNAQTMLNLKETSDKQKVFTLIKDFSKLVQDFDGVLCASGGEGRLKAPFTTNEQPDDIEKLYRQIKQIFDPNNILNPGVKFDADLKDLVTHLTSDYYDGLRF